MGLTQLNARQRLAHIDSLRGIAAFLVIWNHVTETFVKLSPAVAEKGTWMADIALEANFGRIGVLLFFAISGFVIPYSFKGDVYSGSVAFVVKRFFRLFPLFWSSMLGALVILFWIPGRDVGLDRVLANATMIPEFLGYQPLVGLYWTLAIELTFYGLCLLLFLFRVLDKPGVLAALCIAFFSVFIAHLRGWDSRFAGFRIDAGFSYYCSFLGVMFWGASVRYWHDHRSVFAAIALSVTSLVILAPGVGALYRVLALGAVDIRMFAISQLVPPVLFLLGVFVIKLRSPVFVWFGVISYSAYLMHPLVFQSIFDMLVKYDLRVLMGFHLSVYLAASLFFIVLVSALTYRYIESPANRFGHHLSKTILSPIYRVAGQKGTG